jgi:hypothetical protein
MQQKFRPVVVVVVVALSLLLSTLVGTTPCSAFTIFESTSPYKITSHHNDKRTHLIPPLREEQMFADTTPVSNNNKQSPNIQQWFTKNMLTVYMISSISSVALLLLTPLSASASYSAYAHREEDWQQRVSQNAIQVTTPKVLRDQLREIAPMNEERSRIFCPNGPSAAVSPLMENRCSDLRQATPSVFGRSDDVVGNSIPGFSKEWTSSIYSSSADPGGLPEYGFTKSNRK